MAEKSLVGLRGETGVRLTEVHALGSRITPGRSLEHLSDDTIVYISGQHVAQFQWDTQQHRFILKGTKTAEIVTFCVSANRKYIALAERMVDGTTQVNIYTQHTTSKVRSLDFKYLSKLPVVSMSFSTDNKYLATVTALPDVFIYLWQVDKARLVGMVDVPFEISRISISPWAYWSMCTTGPSSLKLWRLVDKQLKPADVIPRGGRSGAGLNASASALAGSLTGGGEGGAFRFTCHAWYDEERFVAGTEEGDLLVVESGETRRVMRTVHGEGRGVTAVQSIARGLLVGGDGGILSLWERTFGDGQYFRQQRMFSTTVTSPVVELSVSPKEDTAVVLYRSNEMSQLSIEAADTLKAAGALSGIVGGVGDAAANAAAGGAVPLPIGFHDDEVTAVDVCTQKPILVTGSLDRTLRVWNYLRRRTEFVKTFDEEVLCLSLHPTGLRVIVGFRTYMRMYNVLTNDLHFCSEFPLKGCHEVRFSTGGSAFAAVVAHRIMIFNSYDFQHLAQFSHTVLVRSIHWSAQDTLLTSADISGVMYQWHVDTKVREDATDEQRKNVSYNCARVDETTGLIAVATSCQNADGSLAEGDLALRCMRLGNEPRVVHVHQATSRPPASRKQHTAELALAPTAHTVFLGSPNGQILLYRWPLQEDARPYTSIDVHCGEVLFLVLSRDERYLFSVGSDRSLYMWEVESIVDGKTQPARQFNFAAFEDVCYVLQADMEEKQRELQQLQTDYDDLAVARARDEQQLIQKYEQERSSRETEFSEQKAFLKSQLDNASQLRDEAEQALAENAKQLEAIHLKAAEELEALYTKRSEEATSRYQQLKVDRDDMVVRYENRIFKLQKEQEAERRKLQDRLKEAEDRFSSEKSVLRTESTLKERVSEDMIDQTIVDYETMLDEIAQRHLTETRRIEEELQKANSNSATGDREVERLKKEKTNLQAQIADKESRISDLDLNLEKQRKDNASLTKEMDIRCQSIAESEKKIQLLKKQTSELEKRWYVLTFKYEELKKEVAPKERQVHLLTQRVTEMDSELEKIASDREALKQSLDHREDRLKVLQRDIRGQGFSLTDKERRVTTLLAELTALVEDTDTKRLPKRLQEIIDTHGGPGRGLPPTTAATTGGTRAEGTGADGTDHRTTEFERQREYMESQLACVKRQNKQQETGLRLDNQRSTAENAVLVKEVNELRHEKRQLATKCGLVEAQLKEARTALQRATAAAPTGGGVSIKAPRAASVGATPQKGDNSFGMPPIGRGSGAAAASAARGAGGAPPSVGRLVRGSTRASRDVAQLDAEKIGRIIEQVELNNAEMQRQEEEIARLRDFVAHLLERAEASAAELSDAERQRHAEIRQHLVAEAAATS